MSFSHKHQVMLTISIIAVLFTIILLMLGPTIKGYNTVKEFKKYGLDVDEVIFSLEKINSEREVVNFKLSTCTEINKDYEQQVRNVINDSFKNIEQIKILEREIEILKMEFRTNLSSLERECELRLSTFKEENQFLSEILNQKEENLNFIIENSANNICCKHRVDFPNTDSYFISNNRIVCANGEENPITCS
jgi:hypothetical protein